MEIGHWLFAPRTHSAVGELPPIEKVWHVHRISEARTMPGVTIKGLTKRNRDVLHERSSTGAAIIPVKGGTP